MQAREDRGQLVTAGSPERTEHPGKVNGCSLTGKD